MSQDWMPMNNMCNSHLHYPMMIPFEHPSMHPYIMPTDFYSEDPYMVSYDNNLMYPYMIPPVFPQIMVDIDEDDDEAEDADRDDTSNYFDLQRDFNDSDLRKADANYILREIERRNPSIFGTLNMYGLPYPVAHRLVSRIIKLTLHHCKK